MNSQYRKNLKDAMTACKNYTDKKIEDLKWYLGTYDLSVETVNGTTMLLPTPANTIEATMVRVDGASEISENKAVNPTINNNVSNNFDAIIIISNLNLVANQTYTVSFINNNTLASGCRYYITADNGSISYTYTGAKSSKTEYSFTFTPTSNESTIRIRLQYNEDTTKNSGTTTNVMLNSGSSALPYEVGYTGIHNFAWTGVKVDGSNLFDIHTEDTFSYQYESWNPQAPRSNSTNTYVENDTINCNSRTGTISYLGFKVNFNKTGTYIVAFDKNNTNRSCFSVLNKTDMAMVLYREDIPTSGRITVTFTIDDLSKEYYLGFTNYSSNSILSNVMLNYGSTALTYTPYIAPTTTTIDLSSILYNGSPLFDNNVLRKNDRITPYKATKSRGVKTINETLIYLSEDGLTASYSIGGKANSSCTIVYSGSLNINIPSQLTAVGNVIFTSTTALSRTEWDNAVLGTIVEYDLATPIEADIDFSQLVKFEAYSNGSITLVNTNNQDTTSTFKYLKEVAE